MHMATSIFYCLLLLLFLSCSTNSTTVTSSDNGNDYLISSQLVSRATVEKQSHFRFYYHDMFSGPARTAVSVARGPETNTSASRFGLVVVMDDPLTVGPDLKSKLVGRAKGIYAAAGLAQFELAMTMNIVFIDGKYNGSTIAILGHIQMLYAVQEMPIIGGSGLFRFARGYVQARPYMINRNFAIVEYNVFVNHY